MELTYLGKGGSLPSSPDEAILDIVANPRPTRPYVVRFTAPEFTSLCPVTGQPDFAHLVIDYVPARSIVESKSLKLFLGAFRNHAGFHEETTVGIGERLWLDLAPSWLRIGGYWYPRGGIPIDVFWQSGAPPEGLWLPLKMCRAIAAAAESVRAALGPRSCRGWLSVLARRFAAAANSVVALQHRCNHIDGELFRTVRRCKPRLATIRSRGGRGGLR